MERKPNGKGPRPALLVVSLPPDVRDKVVELAEAQGVTPSQMVELLLRRSMGWEEELT